MEMPAVSVIIPVYNVEPYIARCARSLFSQTMEDLEFIFVDDCTPDRSLEVVREVLSREFPARESQVRFFRMPVNGGLAKARMQGLALATGEYVIHCDSDDELTSPDAYRLLYEKAVAERLDIVTCNYLKEDASGRRALVRGECKGVRDLLLDKAQGCLWCRLIRRAILNGLLAPRGDMGEDLVQSLQATLRAGSMGHVDEPFYLYRYRPSAISKLQGKEAALRRHRELAANVGMLAGLLVGDNGYREVARKSSASSITPGIASNPMWGTRLAMRCGRKLSRRWMRRCFRIPASRSKRKAGSSSSICIFMPRSSG